MAAKKKKKAVAKKAKKKAVAKKVLQRVAPVTFRRISQTRLALDLGDVCAGISFAPPTGKFCPPRPRAIKGVIDFQDSTLDLRFAPKKPR